MLKGIIEALLFSQQKPLSISRLAKILKKDEEIIQSTIEELKEDYKDRAIELVYIGGGFKFQTKGEFSKWIEMLSPCKNIKLSHPTLVTLAIIAYNQPITKQEIEKIRGQDASWAIKTLLNYEFIEIQGQKKTPGNPFLYRTTRKFLEKVGLPDISSLPKLK